MSSTAMSAEPFDFNQHTDIAFQDIFETLATKINRTSDQAFFENEVLQGRAERSPNPYNTETYQYTYGSTGVGSSYLEEHDGKSISVQFVASGHSTCLTFKQAETDLHKHGWSRKRGAENLYPPAEDIYAVYIRRGVSLKINNFEMLMPWLEPFNSAEGNRQILAEADIRRQERSKIRRGTKAYDKLCVTSVSVNFVR